MSIAELFCKGARVWIPHRDLVWEGAELLENYDPRKPTLLTRTESGEIKTLNVQHGGELPFLRNPAILIGENDLTSLSYLHEPAVLYNLQVRFCQQKNIYTYCGIVLVAINPYDELPIYGTDTIQEYRGQAMGDLDPHIFAVAEDAYTKLEREYGDQSIIVSGESGAGKTVSAKYAMRYFATVGGSSTETQIERKVLASSPIMEAIGNAKTIRNDNSSRFGKFTELRFNKQYHISGASMRTYLLEKTRVVFQAPDERNYHIFYQMCAARGELPELRLGDPGNFRYLNQGRCPSIDGVDDLDQYRETVHALKLLGFTEEERNDLFKVLASVLHLGNVQFVDCVIAQEQNQEGCKVDDLKEHLSILSNLLEINLEEIAAWLCTKKIVSMREIILKPMTAEQSMAARDALAKHIYAKLFEWFVLTINKALESDTPPHKFIGVLDIYGFETFETNSFEQFCINYANEKLQQQFNMHVFKLEQEEYVKEGIEWKMIDFYDNQPCIDLIETKLGVLDLLDEECKMPRGSDRSWTEKLYSKCVKYSNFGKAKFGTFAFVINHFADKVQYESNGFLEKNRDTVMEEQIDVLKNSKNRLVRKLFCESHNRRRISTNLAAKNNKKTVGSQFRDSLNLLMATLNATTPHYVRCIKPNDSKAPFEYNHQRAVQQLRACGVLETIRISAAGYPSRWSYVDFFRRYRVLCKFKDIDRDDMERTCANVLKMYIKEPDLYQFGRTKIFFRAGQVAYLEKLRYDKLTRCCIVVQSTIRSFLCRKKYVAIKNAVYNLQRYWRGYLARKRVQEIRMNRSAVVIQKHVRGWIKRIQYKRIKYTVETIQRYSRGYLARSQYVQLKINAKATIIQKYVRGYLARKHYALQLKRIVTCQAAVRRFLAKRLYKKMKIEARSIEHVKSLNKGLENKIISLQQKIDEVTKMYNSELKKKKVEFSKLKNNLTAEIRNLSGLVSERDRKITELEESLRAEMKVKIETLGETENYKAQLEEQCRLWKNEMSKLQEEREKMNEIVTNYEQRRVDGYAERIEHEKLLLRYDDDGDRSAYQKLLHEKNALEQRCEELESILRQGRHVRNSSDASSIASSSMVSSITDDNGYGSVKSTLSNVENQKSPDQIRLILQLQRRLADVEVENARLQKRLDDVDATPRAQLTENAVRDSIMVSELELYVSNLKTALYELEASFEDGNVEKKLNEQHWWLREELERKCEEVVRLKQVLANQSDSMRSIVNSKMKTGEYINEDGELALAYETQKTINKQLELELQDEQAKFKAYEKEYKIEIEKLREDNERQQRLLSTNLLVTPLSKSEVYMQQEIARLTKENLDLRSKYDISNGTVRNQRKQIEVLMKRLWDTGIEMDDTLKNNEGDNLNVGPALPMLRKKKKEYLGMLSYKSSDESIILKHLIIDLKPRVAIQLLPGLPAYIIFMCIRHIDFTNNEDKVQSLLTSFINCVKKVVKQHQKDFETVTLWLSNILKLINCMKQYSGHAAFQIANTQKQNEQRLRNFDLSDYTQLFSDVAILFHSSLIKDLEEKIHPLIVPAILEHEESNLGMNGIPSGKKASKSTVQKPTDALLEELTNHHKILLFYGVDNDVISQIFRQIFYFICGSSLNNLLLRKELCNWSKGYNIRHNLSYFEMWTKDKKMDSQAILDTLNPILQASHLLQAKKTDDDVVTVCELCSSLTASQVCKILNLYTPVDEFEQRASQSFIAKAREELQKRENGPKQDNLLMDVNHRFPVHFLFNPSSVCLEDVDVPDVLKLSMLEKL